MLKETDLNMKGLRRVLQKIDDALKYVCKKVSLYGYAAKVKCRVKMTFFSLLFYCDIIDTLHCISLKYTT